MTATAHNNRTPEPAGSDGRLVENLMLFARTLRAAGLPVGPGRVLQAVDAMRAVGIDRRDDLYWALHAVFVNRREEHALFDQAFQVFWRNPRLLDRLRQLVLPETPGGAEENQDRREIARRLAEALSSGSERDTAREEREEIEIDAAETWSREAVLRTMDFESMGRAEIEDAKRAIARFRLPVRPIRTRRHRPAQHPGQADLRRTMRAALRAGRDDIPLQWRRQRHRPPPLVMICDISGSMAQYSRMVLHFMHTVTRDRDRVHSFVFGTELTNITHHLRHQDVDEALAKVGSTVTDWEGGTRIGHCLHTFNRLWARRVLGQGAVVLLITDGLDRDNAEGLRAEMKRLHKSARHVLWLNPLLRYSGYAPKSLGARAMLPYVDDFRPVHNLASLSELADVLSAPIEHRTSGMAAWRAMIA
ncbi:hypothetical protein SAMN05216241_102304 [Limimonas halophila]|uniref:VWFA domain-containing protein n=1 Tax=Limimonas halophila TaxID=1082479 RepID=A0A1G7NVY5_9PROT|nr:VWA domain-containing protein [Limimonas halophila]SDF77380.1 hypothetical protein SAMN05216241_102304 [Limimonas halophila]